MPYPRLLSVLALSSALLLDPFDLARAADVSPARTLDVKSFGAAGDGKTDDTKAVQKAIDACKSGDTLVFAEGRFLVRSVVLKPGVHYLGKEAVIARPDHQPGWTRTFTTSYSSDEDSALTTLEGLTFDGNRKNQGPYTKYEQGQSHLVFLAADSAHKGRVRALVKNCHFRECVADGLSVYTNIDVQVGASLKRAAISGRWRAALRCWRGVAAG